MPYLHSTLLGRISYKHLIILDKDRFDLSNTNRQLLYAADIGKYKAFTLARNLVPHAVRQTYITAIALPFEEVLRSRMQSLLRGVNLAVFGVDNDHCRLDGALWARHLHIPAVFTALSLDGTRCECFLQERNPQDACLHCALPELHPALAAPCAFASITSCFLASAYTLYFCERALCGWGEGAAPFNWRMADLRGLSPERTGRVKKRLSCPTCGPLK